MVDSIYLNTYQLMVVNPSKSGHFIILPLTSYPIFAENLARFMSGERHSI